MVGRLSKEQRLRRVVEDVLVGSGYTEVYTWSLVADDPDPGALRPARSAHVRARGSADDAPARARRCRRAQRQHGERGHCALRARARLPAERRAAARGALARRRHRGRRLLPRQGSGRGDPPNAQGRALASSGRSSTFSIRARRHGSTPAGSASFTRPCWRASGASSSSTSPRSSPTCPSGSSTTTSSRTRPCDRISRSSSTRTCSPATFVAAAREAAGPELREARDLRRLPRRPDSAPAASRWRSTWPSSRRSARSRTTMRAPSARRSCPRSAERFGAELRGPVR